MTMTEAEKSLLEADIGDAEARIETLKALIAARRRELAREGWGVHHTSPYCPHGAAAPQIGSAVTIDGRLELVVSHDGGGYCEFCQADTRQFTTVPAKWRGFRADGVVHGGGGVVFTRQYDRPEDAYAAAMNFTGYPDGIVGIEPVAAE